jgi:hypothetical protein
VHRAAVERVRVEDERDAARRRVTARLLEDRLDAAVRRFDEEVARRVHGSER